MQWKREGTKVSEQLMLKVKDESSMAILGFLGSERDERLRFHVEFWFLAARVLGRLEGLGFRLVDG